MYTQCPHCDAIFQLTTAQLKAANGEVRCGQCLTIFNALSHLSEVIPTQAESANAPQDLTPSDTASAIDDPTPVADDHEPEVHSHEPKANSLAPETNSREPEANSLTPDTDIFNDVIAAAHQNNLPSEEIDLFEEFLSADTLPPGANEAEAKTATDSSSSLSDEKRGAVDGPIDSPDNFSNTDPSFGDAAAAMAALDFELHMAADAKRDDKEPHINIDDEFAEFAQYSHEPADKPATFIVDAAVNTAVDTESDAIIIEEADLAPITSETYTDKLTTSTDGDNSAAPSPEPTAETKIDPAAETPEHNVPSLILEEMHAAKAERLRPSTTPWMIGSLVLMLTLVLQVAYHSRDELVKDASLRPWLIQMCQWANCTLSQPYDIEQIEIIGREVRTHPSARKALIASTTLINNASFVQPFPLLILVFSDINGMQLARRRFSPREYLNNSIDLAAGMTPDMPVRIELELVDPGKAAVNYEFHAELDPRNTRPLT